MPVSSSSTCSSSSPARPRRCSPATTPTAGSRISTCAPRSRAGMGSHEPDEAMRYLELAERHPLAARLRLVGGARHGDDQRWRRPRRKLGALDRHRCCARARRGVAVPLRPRRPRGGARATALLDEAPEAAPAHARRRARRARARRDRRLDARRSRSGAPRSRQCRRPDDVAATAALVLDRASDAAAALDMCWTAIERLDAGRATRSRSRAGDARASAGCACSTSRSMPRQRTADRAAARAARSARRAGREPPRRRARGARDAARRRRRARRATASTPRRRSCGRSSPTITVSAPARGAAHRDARRSARGAAAQRSRRCARRASRARRQRMRARSRHRHAWRALELAAVVGESPSVGSPRARGRRGRRQRASPSAGSISLELAAPTAGHARAARGARRPRAALGRDYRRAARRSCRARSSCGSAPASTARLGTEHDHSFACCAMALRGATTRIRR